jgi:signal transduction histidine kinase
MSDRNLHTYPNEVKQVILKLIKNAEDILIENNITNGQITIKSNRKILEISDNGGGIPEEIISKIFDPYFSTKIKKDGTGLGLYMSKIIIEEHCGGTLSVSNDEKGAVFKTDLNKA